MANFHTATIVGTLLALTFLAEAFWFGTHHSLTYDETAYLNLSIKAVQDRRLDPRFMTLGVAPLPALLTYAGPIMADKVEAASSDDPSEGRLDAAQLIRAPRFLNSLIIGVPLVATIFLWLYRRRGLAVAALGGGLAAFSPTFIAHGAIATTDACLTLFSTLGIAAIAWSASAPSAARLFVCAAAIAAAMSSKYSGVFLLPVAAGVFLLSSIRRQHQERGNVGLRATGRDFIVHGTLVIGLSLPLWWGAHLFARGVPEDITAQEVESQRSGLAPPVNSFPNFVMTLAPVVGLRHQILHNSGGGDNFLMGERSIRGWWYYFPLVFIFKSTPAELLLAAFLLTGAGVALIRAGGALRNPWRTLAGLDGWTQSLLLAAVVFTVLLLTSRLNFGHRYMMPMYPILIIAACEQLAVRLHRRRWLLGAAASLLLIQAWSSLTIGPHYLAYVNWFAGGPANGWRLLADSSLDWGQDLPALRAYIDSRPGDLTAMKYFGTDLPDAYGIRADDIEHLGARPEDYTLLALSATYLNGLHMAGHDPFQGFRGLEPDAQLGYSILVYDLHRPEAGLAFQQALGAIRQ